jgi:hypothetical protein
VQSPFQDRGHRDAIAGIVATKGSVSGLKAQLAGRRRLPGGVADFSSRSWSRPAGLPVARQGVQSLAAGSSSSASAGTSASDAISDSDTVWVVENPLRRRGSRFGITSQFTMPVAP